MEDFNVKYISLYDSVDLFVKLASTTAFNGATLDIAYVTDIDEYHN
jgi:hypothetical protein